ncbi:MAG TPA: hypothetical protein VFN78_02535 [Ktedonobacterales bacterium]|nr:hypothetical protein [Ktedonobacterales bacterium]
MPVATSAYTIKIGGVSVTAEAGTLDLQMQIGQRSTGSVTVKTALGVTYAYGAQIAVYDSLGALVYSGYITQDKMTRDPGARQGDAGWLRHDLTLMDNCYRADKRVAFYTTLARSAGGIVADLVTNYLAAEGVTYTSATVATGPTITEVIWNGKQVSECLNYLAKQSGYWWNIDKNGVLFFQPYGGVSAPFVLDGTTVDATSNLSVTGGNTMYVNRQYVRGAYAQLGSRTETFHGNSLTRNFTLSYELSSTSSRDLAITLNGVAQTIGTKGASGAQWYVAIGDGVVAQDAGGALLGSGDTLSVTYKGRYPILALAANTGLISAQKGIEGGGSGYVESVYADTKVHTQGAAFQIAGGLLAHYGQTLTQLEFDIRATDAGALADGQMLTVNLSDFGLSGKQMLVSGVEISDQRDGVNIWYHVTAVGSPYDVANWQTWFQNLMNQQADPSELSDTADGSILATIYDTQETLHLHVSGSHITTTCALFPMTFPFTLC